MVISLPAGDLVKLYQRLSEKNAMLHLNIQFDGKQAFLLSALFQKKIATK